MKLSRKLKIPLFFAVLLGVSGIFWVREKMRLPKPQGAFQAGQSAPDFSLKDQNGGVFRLADQRGMGALLIFYRGYW